MAEFSTAAERRQFWLLYELRKCSKIPDFVGKFEEEYLQIPIHQQLEKN